MAADALALADCRSSLLGAIAAAVGARGAPRPLAELAGLSGLGFRLQVDAEVSLASAHAFPWAEELPAALSRLGHEATWVHGDETDPALPGLRRRVLALPFPAIAWGIHLPEFGLLLGADGERLRVAGVLDGGGGAEWMPLARLGTGPVPILFALSPGDRRAPDDEAAARTAALLAAVRALRGQAAQLGGFVSGVAAYEVWSDALTTGRVDPAGHAYLAQIAAEARSLAAAWLEAIGERAAGPFRRAAAALCEVAGAWTFPLPEGAALGSRAREEQARLLQEAAAAEREGAAALAETLTAARRTRASAGVTIDDAGTAGAADLFACLRDLPITGLEPEADELRAAPRFRAKLARAGAEVVGHVYYADLAESGAAVDARGRWIYVYCAWVANERRGAGIGRRLFDAVVAEARAGGYQGLLVEATAQPVFLHHASYEALGFEEVDRAEDQARLLSLPAGADARLLPGTAPAPRSSRKLPVVVAEGRPCPLLLRAARNVAAAARACDVALTVRREPPQGIEVGGRRLPLEYIPEEAALQAFRAAARAWSAQTGDREESER